MNIHHDMKNTTIKEDFMPVTKQEIIETLRKFYFNTQIKLSNNDA